MTPIYIDLHIHTSDDPDNLVTDYNLEVLKRKILEIAGDENYLISFTDHNVINKNVYINAVKNGFRLILGSELHIEYDKSCEPYHSHIYFNVESITSDIIDEINVKLNKLYPKKVVSFGDQNIPHIDEIVKMFDDFDFLLLPHGGQSHKTFDKAIPAGARFDTTIERSIYYNQFDGFTARSNEGLEETQRYFKKLGINEFVNLITCTDNYVPENYPNAKSKDASSFIPTWMYSSPTFSGLRLALSESTRLTYGKKPNAWSEFIQKVTLHNDTIDIDVELTSGLNVVIGGSSSGKTLLVDSIFRKINGDFSGTRYDKYSVNDIFVQNPSGILPHYIHQNYIIELINQNDGKKIDDIDIIRNIFPGDSDITEKVRQNLAKFKTDIEALINSVKDFEKASNELSRIPVFSRLILSKENLGNIFKGFIPSSEQLETICYPEQLYDMHFSEIVKIEEFIKKNSFTTYDKSAFDYIYAQLEKAKEVSDFESMIRSILTKYKDEIDSLRSSIDSEQQSKIKNYENLLEQVNLFSNALKQFYISLRKIFNYSINCKTQQIESMGHNLFIENQFEINIQVLKDVFNKYLKTEFKIDDMSRLTPYDLFESRYKKQTPKVQDYDDFINRVYGDLENANKRIYKITTADGKDFDSLSAGWKTSILLDLVLGYEGDTAPLIIDQPEDNLATSYINHGLITAIKRIKDKKQIILVSHNATIPMLGDAQTVVVCTNSGKIVIQSEKLEGKINGKSIVDLIAEITDGGKPSIKKRVKKYNLKQFKETDL